MESIGSSPRRRRLVVVIVLCLAGVAALTACAAGPNSALGTGTGQPAGFWLGLWHGVICPITFVISLFNDNVSIYEVHNNGGWYDFGFVLGLSMAFGGSARSSNRSRRRRAPATPPASDTAA